MPNVIYRDCAPPEIGVHKNTPFCPPVFEIVPAHGCEFGCVYCNVYGLDQKAEGKPLVVYLRYPELIEKHLKDHQADLKKCYYYLSPKTDCFQNPLLESGITEKIINLFAKYQVRYLIVTKGDLENYPKIFQALEATKDKAQILISYGMPSEEVREIMEPNAKKLSERLMFAEKCKKAGLQTTGILEPLLPLDDMGYAYRIMDKFKAVGIEHFAIDFARITKYTLDNIKNKLPVLAKEMAWVFGSADTKEEIFKTGPLKERSIVRYAPSEKYLRDKFENLKKYAQSIGCTVSVCNVFNINGFNLEAGQKGYICMGIQTRM